jgi:hypothetical protein
VYYVAPNGNDANPGTQSQPFATLQHALFVAQDGNVVHMMPGVHNLGGANLTMADSITLEGEGTDSVVTNGRRITIMTGVTIRDLVFRDFDHSSAGDSVLQLGSGANIDGLVIERVVFESAYGAIWGRKFDGNLTNARIADCTIRDIVAPVMVHGIFIATNQTMSNIEIVGNTITNVATTSDVSPAYVVFLGLDLERPADHVLIDGNVIDGVTGGTQENSSYYAEARAILTYGDYHTISNNQIRNINQGIAHTGIYVKGSHTRILNNVIYRGGSTDVGSGDITVKGNGNVDNVISGNTVTSDAPGGGMVILTKGEATIENNYVRHQSAGYGIYSYDVVNGIWVRNNYVEVLGRAVGIYNAPTGSEYAHNTIISYEGPIKMISGDVHVHDNNECLGYECIE